ncbi:hypothetical protein [Tropicimonas isoalkanivorans]|uniref:Putative flavoprotein involved in K+ transport n=1 Tax=Tropicimonas isoalkanivorans TaxID=441112 RepID=A0A1I1HLT0_9RHOB|nr:hypothetical protein [Tropicimonas isoalkanivorans]SFC22928.1 putative flavoprotein involved in K+ transport [Tropicimonas isoalkanivorans]
MTLARLGATITGRVTGVEGTAVRIADTLATDMAAAEGRRERTLARIDDFILRTGADAPAAAPSPTLSVPDGAATRALDLRTAGIRTIVWATGFRRTYPWLEVPVLDRSGEIAQSGGLTACPGLYTLGLPFMRRRNSTFIDGVGQDAREISADIAHHLERSHRDAA